MPNKTFGGVAALNKDGHHSVATIAWSIEVAKPKYRPKDREEITGEISISDCSRVISLDISIDAYNAHSLKENYDNAVFKIDTMIEQLTQCKDVLETAVKPELKKRKKKKKKKKRKNRKD